MITMAQYHQRAASEMEVAESGTDMRWKELHVARAAVWAELAKTAPTPLELPEDIDPTTCPTPGCKGDVRYAAPGRGHLSSCTYPAPRERGTP